MSEPRKKGPLAPRASVDREAHLKATNRRLVAGGFALLFIVGGGIILYMYDLGAMLAAWSCLFGGVLLFGLLYGLLKLMEIWTDPDRRRDE